MSAAEQYKRAIDASLISILDIIAEYYSQQHGVESTSSELLEYLEITSAPTPSRLPAVSAPRGPARPKAPGSTPTSATGTKRTRTSTKAAAIERRSQAEGQIKGYCLYVLTRGDNADKYCINKCVVGSNKCSGCSSKKGNIGFYADDDGLDETDSGRAPGNFASSVPEEDDASGNLTVSQYLDSDILYISEGVRPTLLLVIDGKDEDGEDKYSVIGQMSLKNKILPLKSDGLKQANIQNLDVNQDMLQDLAERGLIEVADENEIEDIPSLNTSAKKPVSTPAVKKPAPPVAAPKRPTAPSRPMPARKPAVERNVKADVDVDIVD